LILRGKQKNILIKITRKIYSIFQNEWAIIRVDIEWFGRKWGYQRTHTHHNGGFAYQTIFQSCL